MAEARGYVLDAPVASCFDGSALTMRVHACAADLRQYVAAFERHVTAATLRRRVAEVLPPRIDTRRELIVAIASLDQRDFPRDVLALVDELNAIGAEALRFELWTLDELQVDVLNHSLVDPHRRADASELPRFVTRDQCEVLRTRDPVARRLDFRAGELVRIDRVDSQSGLEVTYRRVEATNE